MKGLSEGEQVVTRANFLIDSESRLRASLAAMVPARRRPTTPAPGRRRVRSGADDLDARRGQGGKGAGRD